MEFDALRAGCAEEVIATGLKCPLPLLKTKKALARIAQGARVYLAATDPNTLRDLRAYAAEAGHRVEFAERIDDVYHVILTKGGADVAHPA
ncbi:MAG: sulfurtransferase TusA family protein [Gammaproteobacteria bacterium]